MPETANPEPAVSLAQRSVLVLLVIGFALFDLLTASICRQTFFEEIPWAYFVVFALVTIQINLAAFWTAVGPGRMIVRIPWMVLAITLAYVILLLGAAAIEREPVPQQEQTMIAGVMLFAYLTVTLSLVPFRLITRRCLIRVDQTNEANARFHLHHLILGTAICGMTLAVLNWSGYPIAGVADIDVGFMLAIAVVALVNLLITLPAICSAFGLFAAGRKRYPTLVLITLVLTGGEIFAFLMLAGDEDFLLVFSLYLFMNLTQCFGLVGTLSLVQAAGYELRVIDGAAPNRESVAAAPSDPWTEED